jgi:hypothetical protein
MNRLLHSLPTLITVGAALLLLLHGPIPQLPDYHAFADRTLRFGLPHAADVLSNIGFALVGLWGFARLRPLRHEAALRAGWHGYRLFLLGLVLTAIGSAFYHLAPDNARLVWDRLPIALACAGLLAAVRSELRPGSDGSRDAALLALLAVLSVAWWHFTELRGEGDLRPYILLQALPIVLIPLWQGIHGAPRGDRLWFGSALLIYVLAKATELLDHQIAAQLGWISGHTLKHLLATAAAAAIVLRLSRRATPPRGRHGKVSRQDTASGAPGATAMR